ncbi:hypothetical protein PHYSODRAFT_294888 [Phytophthora sojae]|uniref:Uncharacterized protein n=1 Tax=Phytophthora sojae (strain P6497) TaxID=1094619 RepID=G4YJG6_PHYSP|nr:hypothetical protein PHYSODRAFT_294888 [Phytophthora sojae]EGZ29921.1 hypothetical protein PHYSODRAFT_294888 [Phytophthora sojae]|eukprot:XP_009517196.1 hypothetical protein PHYSODRAFT_294888 [Phytophthora sojae]
MYATLQKRQTAARPDGRRSRRSRHACSSYSYTRKPTRRTTKPRSDDDNTTARRTPRSTPSPTTRVSPYPLRVRTPPQSLPPPAPPVCRQARVSLDASPDNEDHDDAGQHRLQLVV